MKVKYKVINDLLMREEDCIAYLEKMALKGWQLEKIGTTFFKFRRQEPKQLKYQFDYNPLTDDYLDLIAMEGYRFIDSFRQLSIFVNENYNAQDLQSDKTTKLMVKKKLFPIWKIIILMICAWATYVLSTSASMYQKSNWGQFFIDADLYIFRYLLILLAVMLLVDAVSQILIRYNINLEANDKKDIRKIVKFILKLKTAALAAMIPGVLFILVSNLVNKPLGTIILGLLLSLYYLSGRYVNKHSFRETNGVKQKIKLFIVLAVYMVCCLVIINREFDLDAEVPPSNLQSAKYTNTDKFGTLFLTETMLAGSDGKDMEYTFMENKYSCLNDFIAREVFEYEIREMDQQARIPSDEEIDKIVEETGRWSINDVEYLSFQEACNNLTRYDSSLVDECYYDNNVYIAIKDDVVLKTMVLDEVGIDKVLEYYFVTD